MDRKVFMAILLSVVVVALVYIAFRLFDPFLLSILWAAVLAAVTYGVYDSLAERLGRPTLAAVLMTLLVFVLIVGPCVLLSLVIANEMGQWNLEAALSHLAERPWAAHALERIEKLLHEQVTPDRIATFAREHYLSVLLSVSNVLGFVFSMISGMVMMLLCLFFFYRDGRAIVRVVHDLMPMAEEDRREILSDIDGAVQASVRGGLFVALVQGILGFVILLVLGRSSAVLGGAFMGIASFIPLVGTAVVWAPLSLYMAFVEGAPVKGLVLAGYGILVIGTADNLVRPLFLGRHMEAHPLLLFLGVLGGITLFGFAGIVLGPIVVAFLNVSARLLRRRFADVSSS
jgi:predicted PurR-regulated permease PerM